MIEKKTFRLDIDVAQLKPRLPLGLTPMWERLHVGVDLGRGTDSTFLMVRAAAREHSFMEALRRGLPRAEGSPPLESLTAEDVSEVARLFAYEGVARPVSEAQWTLLQRLLWEGKVCLTKYEELPVEDASVSSWEVLDVSFEPWEPR